MFGSIAATRSPAPTPAARIACCRRETSAASSSQVSRRSTLSSPRKTIAVPAPRLPQQVLGKIQPRVREEARLPHRAACDHAALALLADDAAEIPDQVPEGAGIADRPGVQRVVVGEALAGAPAGLRRESGDRQRRQGSRIGRPERSVGHRSSRAGSDRVKHCHSGRNAPSGRPCHRRGQAHRGRRRQGLPAE